jgi:hypothetical protein
MLGDGAVFEGGQFIVVDLGLCIELLDRWNVSGVQCGESIRAQGVLVNFRIE